MISLNVYLSTTGGGKRDIMRAFGDGARLDGVEVCYVEEHQYRKSDFAMVFAYKSEGTDSPNHRFRQEVVKKHNDNIFFVDSNVLKAYEKDVRYFRFPMSSIHPHEANYLIDGDTTRNNQIIKHMNIDIKPWRTDGKHICLFLNRGIGGFSTFGKPCYEWAKETIEEIRKYSDRPILIRSHRHAGENQQLKEDRKNLDFILSNYKDITHTRLGETSIYDDLKNAWACVVYTSTSGAVAMLEGIPMFSTHEACFSHKWSAGNLSDIEKPALKDRTNYITHYANAHWNLEEVRQGILWRKYASAKA
tara:strand:+ start:521 stop:1432 length:912 start_codon:yes stop_codon:yes gene_type:complete